MRYLLWVGLWVVMVACTVDEQHDDRRASLREQEGSAPVEIAAPQPPISPELNLEAKIAIDKISEERRVVQPKSDTEASTVANKRTEALRASPFFHAVPCRDWTGRDDDISAACCKTVVSQYASISQNPEQTDLGIFAVTDPYLGACKVFNAEFRAAIDKIEHPEEDNDDGAPPF